MSPSTAAPWPLNAECHEPAPCFCPQHNPDHLHAFVAWKDHLLAGEAVPVRCRECGARKCDRPACSLMRHHRGEHVDY